MVIPTLRATLCPPPSLRALLAATTNGTLARLLNDAPRHRHDQAATLTRLLKGWLVG